jgi:DNA polymerase
MSIVTIDFETYYSKEFSLTKLTTEEYVRSDQFEVIGVSAQVDDGEPEWFTGTMEETQVFLYSLNLEKHAVLAHNTAFDGAILTWLFGIKPKHWLDTLSMARAIHGTEVGGSLAKLATYYDVGAKGEEVVNALGLRRLDFPADQLIRYGEYCKNDTALTYKIFKLMMAGFPLVELKLIDITLRMFTEPVLELDRSELHTHLQIVRRRKEGLLQNFDKDTLMSNPKFAELLKAHGVEPPMKTSPATGKQTYAFSKTDEEFKELLNHDNLEVQSLVAARLGTKSTLEETRTARFLGMSQRGLMPVPLRYYAAHTGRWGGDDKVNLQNLPRNSPIKKAVVAPEGFVLIDSDSSQIEARTLAWLSEQNDLTEAFENGQDVYKIMASAIYVKGEADITGEERFVGKTTILGAGYGMGSNKFKTQLKTFGVEIQEEESKRIITTYRDTYPKIVELWQEGADALKAIMLNQTCKLGREGVLMVEGKKGIKLPNGLYLRYPNLRIQKTNNKSELVYDNKKGRTAVPTRIYGGKVIENVCQALARIVIGEQMLMIAKKYKVAMTVHDAVMCVVPEYEATPGQEYVEMCMRMRPTWAQGLPLNCEAGKGHSYGDC